ncbi:MAG: YceI family protein [Ferruginibacter sp.]
MKSLILSLTFTMLMSCLFAQTYTATDNGSDIKFSIKNFGLNVSGSFKQLKGKILFNPTDLSSSSINAIVDAVSVNTGNDSRDNHLKKEEYFDVKKYPVISFVSNKITKSANGSFLTEGTITIKGVAKTISFPFTATPKGEDYLFEGQVKLNRRDFGVGGSSLVLSDNLSVSLSILAKKSN